MFHLEHVIQRELVLLEPIPRPLDDHRAPVRGHAEVPQVRRHAPTKKVKG